MRISPSHACKIPGAFLEGEGVEAGLDESQGIEGGQSRLLGLASAGSPDPPEALGAADRVLAELARAVDDDLRALDHAPSTARAYAHDWADFCAFCSWHGLVALPAAPQTLALYMKALQTRTSRSPAAVHDPKRGALNGGLAISTLRRRLAAIAAQHTKAGLETPTEHALVRRMLRRYARSRGTAAQKKDPILIEVLPALLAPIADDLVGRRDRALILLGYAGAFRRAELVALDVEDLRCSKKGLYVWIAGAKNDPRRHGRELYVPRLPNVELCAVAALERWLEVVGERGPVFRTFDLRGALTANRLDPGDVARILRRRGAAAGLVGDFAGHSLRRGFITDAAKKKIPIANIQRVTGQRSSRIVLDYVAAATVDEDPPLLEIVGAGA
jgi:integrase